MFEKAGTAILSITNNYECTKSMVYRISGKIDAIDVCKAKLKIKVLNPKEEIVFYEMFDATKGCFNFDFTAHMDGEYQIVINYDGHTRFSNALAELKLSVKPVSKIPTNIEILEPSEEVHVGDIVEVQGRLTSNT